MYYSRRKRIKFQLECDNEWIKDCTLRVIENMDSFNEKRFGFKLKKNSDDLVISGSCNIYDWEDLMDIIQNASKILTQALPHKPGITRLWLYLAK